MELSKDMIKEIGQKHWVKIQEENILLDDEQLLGVTKGVAESSMRGEKLVRECRLMITDTRMIVYMPKMLGRYELEDYSYDQLTSVKKHKGLAFAEVSFSVAGNWQKIGMINKKKVDVIHKLLQEQIKQSKQPPIVVVAQAPAITPTGSKFCGECGTPINPQSKFCSNCGTPIQ